MGKLLVAGTLALLAAAVEAVPATDGATLAPQDVATVAAAAPVASSAASISLQATPLTPPSPPPPPQQCTSHDVYLALMEAMTMTQNMTISTQASARDAQDSGTQTTVLVLVGILSFCLLLFGSTFATAALAGTTFLISFLFVFGIADGAAYRPELPASFSMCVLPLAMAVMAGVLVSLLCMCLIQRMTSAAFFIMGACIGGVSMYVIREIIISASPSLASNSAFGWYWLATAVVALLFGFLAALAKDFVFFASTVAVGAYGVATFICGIIPVAGGQPVGGAAFVVIMIGSAAVGATVQYACAKNKKESKKASSGKDPLLSS